VLRDEVNAFHRRLHEIEQLLLSRAQVALDLAASGNLGLELLRPRLPLVERVVRMDGADATESVVLGGETRHRVRTEKLDALAHGELVPHLFERDRRLASAALPE